jgi:hypothetical protein
LDMPEGVYGKAREILEYALGGSLVLDVLGC